MRLHWLRRRPPLHRSTRPTSADSLLRWWLSRLRSQSGDRPVSAGFTLAELLITLVISSIIVTGLLTLVVDLVTTNRKELAYRLIYPQVGHQIQYFFVRKRTK